MSRTALQPTSSDRRALLEQYLRARVTAPPRPAPTVPRREPGQRLPLSHAQEQVWLHAQLTSEIPVYNEPVTIHHAGPLDVPALERSFNEVLRRHEAWRTSFEVIDGQPVQRVHPALSVTLEVLDLSTLPAGEREAEALRIATADAVVPLRLEQAPLFRARLVRLDAESHRLYLTLHHIIFDGVAIYRVLLPELAAHYAAFAAGSPSPLADLPFQYPDFALWQRGPAHDGKRAADLAFWRKRLAGDLPVLSLPSDRPRPPVQSFRGSMHPFVLDAELARALRELCRSEGVTLFQALLASFAALLARYGATEDVPIGTVTSGRDQPGTEKLLGYFLNTLVLRFDLSGGVSFRELCRRAREATVEALMHDGVPFGTLVNELHVRRDPSRNPLFQVLFSLEPPLPPLPGAWQLTQMEVDTGATKYDLYLELDERRDAILARFHYSTDLFDRATIARMASHWQTLIAAAIALPERNVHELPVMLEAERREVVQTWNATEAPYPDTTIHGWFEACAARNPGRVAVAYGDGTMTYGELDARANRLAQHLRGLGAGPETLVALCVERSLDMVVGLLGILKAGAAYVPLDPAYPEERLARIVSDAAPLLTVTSEALRGRLPAGARLVLLDADRAAIDARPAVAPDAGSRPEHRAYVLYTSGSTGVPKGVQVMHRAVVNVLAFMGRELSFGPSDVMLAVTTFCFDIAVVELFLPLVTGARVVVAPSETARDARELKVLMSTCGATAMQGTPATWRMLREAGWTAAPGLKALVAGEALPPDLGRGVARSTAGLWNLYGPTETTIYSTFHRVEPEGEGPISIGRPVANTRVYVLDRHLAPVPVGTPGELYIGGTGVARGYLNRDELNAERFIPDPFGRSEGDRLYRTGDLARHHSDGTLEYLGRADTQVKVRGFRVELGEIETFLGRHPDVGAAAAAVHEVGPGDCRLVAYVVPRGAEPPTAAALRSFLRAHLPEYMVPSHVVALPALPLTPNGKVDRRSLPAPGVESSSAASAAPRDADEARLVAIWTELLGTPVGIHDDFFALGGHSLLAVQLFARIETELGVSVPLATLLRAPTVAELAPLLRGEREPARWSSLVPLRTEGTHPPLFCIHGHYGEVLFYRPLASKLADRPFYALQSVAADGRPGHDSIEQMASHYLSEMMQVQPHGPYRIAGFCFGTLVAGEMARQLLARGEEVAFLGLFLEDELAEGQRARLATRLHKHLDQLRRDGLRAKVASLATNVAAKMGSILWRAAYRTVRHRLPPTSRFFRNTPEMNVQAALRHTPAFYPGKMTVFLSGDAPEGHVPDPELYLHGMKAQSIELHHVPGDRNSMMKEPHVAVLARKLEASLEA